MTAGPVAERSTTAHGSMARLNVPLAPASPLKVGAAASCTLARVLPGAKPMPRSSNEAPVAVPVCAGAPLPHAVPRKARMACWKNALWSMTVMVEAPRPKLAPLKLSSVACASVLMLPSKVKLPPRKVTL